jgi:hypothetical protein
LIAHLIHGSASANLRATLHMVLRRIKFRLIEFDCV